MGDWRSIRGSAAVFGCPEISLPSFADEIIAEEGYNAVNGNETLYFI